MGGRLVAIGDSFTEGIGDTNLLYPNGVRGWADRLARQLGKLDDRWEYANLAIRSKRIDEVVEEQLDAALALEPTLVSFSAGGNDILALRTDLDAVVATYAAALERILATGAQAIVFTGFDVKVTPLLEPLRRRNEQFSEAVRELAARHGATLVDHARIAAYDDTRMWSADRIHMSRIGHRYMAFHVLHTLGHETKKSSRVMREELPGAEPAGWRDMVRSEARWLGQDVAPLVVRRLRGVNEGMSLPPKWPVPIRPAEGMKRLAATSSGQALGVRPVTAARP